MDIPDDRLTFVRAVLVALLTLAVIAAVAAGLGRSDKPAHCPEEAMRGTNGACLIR